MPAPMGHPPYNTKGEGGRPKIYTEEYLNELADGLIKWIKSDKENMYYEEYFLELEIPPKHLYQFIGKHERFTNAYNFAHSYQEQRLKKGATKREYSEGFTKFILINNHDYKEKSESKISGDPENPFMVMFEQINGKTKDLVNE